MKVVSITFTIAFSLKQLYSKIAINYTSSLCPTYTRVRDVEDKTGCISISLAQDPHAVSIPTLALPLVFSFFQSCSDPNFTPFKFSETIDKQSNFNSTIDIYSVCDTPPITPIISDSPQKK